jgi:hypothetical protein
MQLDHSVAKSMSVEDLIGTWERIAPDLAEALKGKPLIESKTPWGVMACYIIGVLLGDYGLSLSEAGTQILAGVLVLIGSFVMRYISTARINGIVRPADPF